MCTKISEGGLRCSHHAKATLEAAITEAEANPTPENEAKVKDAEYEFNTSPAGIKALREAGKEEEAQHFESLRKQLQAQYKAKQQAKEAAALRKELTGLYSPQGISELRESGEDELADRLEERRKRVALRRARMSAAETVTEDSASPDDNNLSTDTPSNKKPSTLGAIGKGALAGAKAGYRSGNVLHAVNAGMTAGRGEGQRVQAQVDAQEREQERIRVTAERDQEREAKAYEREQERLKRERERQDKADALWFRKLEADALRYLKAQRREAAKQSTSKHTAA
jgi:hypothetical protein